MTYRNSRLRALKKDKNKNKPSVNIVTLHRLYIDIAVNIPVSKTW